MPRIAPENLPDTRIELRTADDGGTLIHCGENYLSIEALV